MLNTMKWYITIQMLLFGKTESGTPPIKVINIHMIKKFHATKERKKIDRKKLLGLGNRDDSICANHDFPNQPQTVYLYISKKVQKSQQL